MKNIQAIGLYVGIAVLLALSASRANAQYIDTACIGEKHAMYRTSPRAGSVFLWTVEGGVIDSFANGGSAIYVNWGFAGGIKKITVSEKSKFGCPGAPVDAFVLLWPTGPVGIVGPDLICKGEDVALKAIGSADRYLWSTGDTSQIVYVKPETDTSFKVTGFFGECGIKSSLHDLRVKYRPVADFTFSPTTPVLEEKIQFNYTGTGNVNQWNWEFIEDKGLLGSSTQRDPDYTFNNVGVKQISLTVRNDFGCTDTITKYIIVESGINVFIPTGFTPNGDGFNNTFKPVYENVLTTDFTILDRWGEIMFKTYSLDEGWDGSYKNVPVPDGVFTYLVQVTGKDKKNYAFSGTVTVLR